MFAEFGKRASSLWDLGASSFIEVWQRCTITLLSPVGFVGNVEGGREPPVAEWRHCAGSVDCRGPACKRPVVSRRLRVTFVGCGLQLIAGAR